MAKWALQFQRHNEKIKHKWSWVREGSSNKIAVYNSRESARITKRVWSNGEWQNLWKFRVVKR